MDPLLARKKSPAPALEHLEDRRLLSLSGTATGRDLATPRGGTPAEAAPPAPPTMAGPWGDARMTDPGPRSATPPAPSPTATPGPSTPPAVACPAPPPGSRPVESPAAGPIDGTASPSTAPVQGADRDLAAPSPTLPASSATAPTSHDVAPLAGAGAISNVAKGLEISSAVAAVADALLGRAALLEHAEAPSATPAIVASPSSTVDLPSRVGVPGPVARSGGDFGSASRVDPATTGGIAPGVRSPAGPSPALVVLVFAPPAGLAGPDHGPTPQAPAVAPTSEGIAPGAPPRLALAPGGPAELGGVRGVGDPPAAPGWGQGGAGASSGVGQLAATRPGDPFDLPDPQPADLITDIFPFDRASLDRAIDQLLDPLDGLASTRPGLRVPLTLVAASMAVATTALAADMALRVRRDRAEADGDPSPFPGLPGFPRWSRP